MTSLIVHLISNLQIVGITKYTQDNPNLYSRPDDDGVTFWRSCQDL